MDRPSSHHYLNLTTISTKQISKNCFYQTPWTHLRLQTEQVISNQ